MATIHPTPTPTPVRSATARLDSATVQLGDVDLEVFRTGEGERALYLHAEDGLVLCGPFLEALGEHATVTAPLHPGWGSAVPPADLATVRDLADLYVELLEEMAGEEGSPVPVVGSSIGAWIAAEMAATRHPAVGPVVLIAPVGVKFGSRTDRDFVDLFAIHPSEQQAVLSSRGMDRLSSLDEEGLLAITRAQEATARYCWKPYFHDPALPRRLRRVRGEVTIIGAGEDSFVLDADYCRRLASLFGGPVEVVEMAGVGHRVEEEVPLEAATEVVRALQRRRSSAARLSPMTTGV